MTDAWFDRVRQSALGWRTSTEFTYDIARLAIERDIPGDFVECGVYAGAQSALMAQAYLDGPANPEGRLVHLFDSFQGIPEPGSQDLDFAKLKGGESACDLAGVQRNMQDWGIPDVVLVYHVGFFSETIPAAVANGEVTQIAVLRLDADLYESTLTALRHLYPLLSPGGFLIVDDYDLTGCRLAVLDYLGAQAPAVWRKHE